MVLIWLIKGVFYKKKFIYKMNEYADLTYYQENRDVMLNRAKDYYENDKEKLRGQARYKYGNLSEEEKIKIEDMGRIDILICPKKKSKD